MLYNQIINEPPKRLVVNCFQFCNNFDVVQRYFCCYALRWVVNCFQFCNNFDVVQQSCERTFAPEGCELLSIL